METEKNYMSVMSEDQRRAAVAMAEGRSIFLTGGAGTGKTHLINSFLSNTNRRIARLATTGAAAQLIGGQTLHSFFGIGRNLHRPGDITVKSFMRRKLRAFDGFVIEEVSMARVDVMRQIRDMLKGAARGYGEFGGYQLIAVGDFSQLPPVLPDEELRPIAALHGPDALYAFQTPCWKALEVHELTTLHRQAGDLDFAHWLDDLRRGRKVDLDVVNARVAPAPEHAVHLVATNRAAEVINEARMRALPKGRYRIMGEVRGEYDERLMRVPVELSVKPGARVIICANNRDRGYVNGSTGTLIDVHRDSDNNPEARVRLDNGQEVLVCRHKWENVTFEAAGAVEDDTPTTEFGRRVRGSMVQLPLLPGWAITIHRSQGMSIECAHISPAGTFEAGQIYVALSRLTRLSGLTLEMPVRDDHIITDPRVSEYYRSLSDPEAALHPVERAASRSSAGGPWA